MLPDHPNDERAAHYLALPHSLRCGWLRTSAALTTGRIFCFAVKCSACARSGIEPNVQHLVTDTAVAIALAESGIGITLATPLMMTLRPTATPTAPLPGESMRSIVAIVRSAALERDSVRAVRDALVHAFSSRTAGH